MKIEWFFFLLFGLCTFGCLVLTFILGSMLSASIGLVSAALAAHVAISGDL